MCWVGPGLPGRGKSVVMVHGTFFSVLEGLIGNSVLDGRYTVG